MGADGGLILKRKDLVKHTTRDSKEDISDSKIYNTNGRWSTCALSNRPLEGPVVSDWSGSLYLKEAVLEFLVDPQSFSPQQRQLVGHIASLKDVVELKLRRGAGGSRFVCPITGNELGSGGVKYVYLVQCGDVFAAKCLREISADEDKCPLCSREYDPLDDVVVLNPVSQEDKDQLERRIQSLAKRSLSHSLKKIKKTKKRTADDSTAPKKKAKK